MKIYNPIEINTDKIYVAFKSLKDSFWIRKELDTEVLSDNPVLICRKIEGHGWQFAYEADLRKALSKEIFSYAERGYVIYICDDIEEFRELKIKLKMSEEMCK